jgi:hypothetical protein
MIIKKIHQDFPVYVIENWHSIVGEDFKTFVEIVKKNKEKNQIPGGASFWVMDDEDGRFAALYDKFYTMVNKEFGLVATPYNFNICNVYYSNNKDASQVADPHGRVYYHTHKHVNQNGPGAATTVAGVYYVNVPDTQSGFIDFKIEEQLINGEYVNIQKDMGYHIFNLRPLNFMADITETKIKEMSYQPKNGDLVLFPGYLDHRPQKSLVEGDRVAVNFELKTAGHPDDAFALIEEAFLKQ